MYIYHERERERETRGCHSVDLRGASIMMCGLYDMFVHIYNGREDHPVFGCEAGPLHQSDGGGDRNDADRHTTLGSPCGG